MVEEKEGRGDHARGTASDIKMLFLLSSGVGSGGVKLDFGENNVINAVVFVAGRSS